MLAAINNIYLWGT